MTPPTYWRYAVQWIDPDSVSPLNCQYTATLVESQELAAEKIREAKVEVRILGVLWEQEKIK